MSLKDNIVEKLYTLLKETKISQKHIDKSEDILLARHFKDLKVVNFNNEYLMFDNIDELKKTAIKHKISQQRLLLGAIINFLTKKGRLEIFLDLTPTFKLIYESLYSRK